MTNINKPSGINIGGVNPFQFVFAEDIDTYEVDITDLSVVITLKSGKKWSYMYGTNETIQIKEKRTRVDAGTLYRYEISLNIPRDNKSTSALLYSFEDRPIVVRASDKNGILRVYGNPDNPMRLTSESLRPKEVQEFNGYDISIVGEFDKPALYQVNDLNGLPPVPDEEANPVD